MLADRGRVMVAATAILVLAVDVLLLTTGIHKAAKLRSQTVAAQSRSLIRRSGELRKLQTQTDDLRQDLQAAFDSLDEVLALGRTPAGVDQAMTKFSTSPQLMDKARVAKLRLPTATGQLTQTAKAASFNARKLLSLVHRKDEDAYLHALDKALLLLLDAHSAHYSKLNTHLIAGESIYEELFTVTNEWSKQKSAGFFSTSKRASDSYDLRTKHLIDPLRNFKIQLDNLQKEVELHARGTLAAFQQAAKLRTVIE